MKITVRRGETQGLSITVGRNDPDEIIHIDGQPITRREYEEIIERQMELARQWGHAPSTSKLD